MYLIYHTSVPTVILAAATRLNIQCDGQAGIRLDNLLIFRVESEKDISLTGGDNPEILARLQWSDDHFIDEEVKVATLGPLNLIRASEIEQGGQKYGVVSRVWTGAHLIPHVALARPGNHIATRRRLTGWSSLERNTPISVAAVVTATTQGYLIYGGDAGLRAGGRDGWTLAPIFLPGSDLLPIQVRRICYAGPPDGAA